MKYFAIFNGSIARIFELQRNIRNIPDIPDMGYCAA